MVFLFGALISEPASIDLVRRRLGLAQGRGFV
jgi:hypothetical protein